MGESKKNDNIHKSKLELDWNEPSKVIAAIFEPIIYQQKYSPPTAIALGCFLLVFVPNWASVKSWADLPINDNDYPIKRI